MRKIYVSDSGDDKGDGLSEKAPIRSWQRFIQLCEGNDEIIIMGDGCTGKMRLIAEIDKKGRIAQAEVALKVSYLQHCNWQRCSPFESEQHRQAAKVASRRTELLKLRLVDSAGLQQEGPP